MPMQKNMVLKKKAPGAVSKAAPGAACVGARSGVGKVSPADSALVPAASEAGARGGVSLKAGRQIKKGVAHRASASGAMRDDGAGCEGLVMCQTV